MAHRLSRALLVAAALIYAFSVTQQVAHSDDPATVSVSPATASATVGDDVVLDINAANVPAQPGIGGYDIVFTWDPAVLDLKSVSDTGWLATGNIVPFCSAAQVASIGARAAAEARCSTAIGFGAGLSTSAPQALVQAVFHAKAAGTTTIALSDGNPPSSLLNPSNDDIATGLTGGSVTVSAPAVVRATTETPAPPRASTPPASLTANTQEAQSVPISQTPSTKPTQETLSKVDVPRTGSGGAAHSGIAWWIPALTATGAALLATGGVTAFHWSRRRRSQDR